MAHQSISSVISDRAHAAPDSVMLIDRDHRVTAGEIDRRANRLGRMLTDRGVRRDDLIVVSLPNGAEFVVACVAIWRVGATPMPLDPRLPSLVRDELLAIARPTLSIGPADTNTETFDAAIDEGMAAAYSTAPLPDVWARSWKAVASSGSTGRPKIVVSTAPALIDPDAAIAPFIPRRAVQLISSPMWHSTAFTYGFRGLLAGHTLVIEPAFDEYRFLDTLQRHGVSWAALSPISIRRLLRLPQPDRERHDLTSLDQIVLIGGRCPIPDKHALIDWLGVHRVTEVYAGSESNGLTAVSGPDWLRRPGTVGRPIGGTEIAIRRDDESPADPGEVGRVWLRRTTDGRTAAPAYRYLGASSRRTDDGWDTLGDLGYLDDDGYLFVIDREADVICTGTHRIYPADVEQVAEELSFVRGAVAFGEPPAERASTPTDDEVGPAATGHNEQGRGEAGRDQASCGEAVAITIQLDMPHQTDDGADGAPRLSEVVADHIEQRLGSHSRPARIAFTTHQLRNDAGKIRRRALARSGRGITEPIRERKLR